MFRKEGVAMCRVGTWGLKIGMEGSCESIEMSLVSFLLLFLPLVVLALVGSGDFYCTLVESFSTTSWTVLRFSHQVGVSVVLLTGSLPVAVSSRFRLDFHVFSWLGLWEGVYSGGGHHYCCIVFSCCSVFFRCSPRSCFSYLGYGSCLFISFRFICFTLF